MKSFFLLIAFFAVTLFPINPINAQRSFGEELLEAAVQGIFQGLVQGLLGVEPEPEPAVNKSLYRENKPESAQVQRDETIVKSDLYGVWENDQELMFMDKFDRFYTSSPNFSDANLRFTGTYTLFGNVLRIYNDKGTLEAIWELSVDEERLSLKNKGYATLHYSYKCSIEEHQNGLARRNANVDANINRFVAVNQGYMLSQSIRNDINAADMRRSYDTERVKALENAKYYYKQGNDKLARAWEGRADEFQKDIDEIDRNNN